MVDYIKEMTAKKSCKDGEQVLFEYLLFLGWCGDGGRVAMRMIAIIDKITLLKLPGEKKH